VVDLLVNYFRGINCFICIKVEERIVKDLQIYYLALNQSVINFHKERMEEVNRIVRELWVSIYKGSDIDYIEIKTESDDKQTGEHWQKSFINNYYNYCDLFSSNFATHLQLPSGDGEERPRAGHARSLQCWSKSILIRSELRREIYCCDNFQMLASLVIRIALAETFSASCGILALDEPTTNLDSNNIMSLGNSLIE
jgi:DNA repair protein RAD50